MAFLFDATDVLAQRLCRTPREPTLSGLSNCDVEPSELSADVGEGCHPQFCSRVHMAQLRGANRTAGSPPA